MNKPTDVPTEGRSDGELVHPTAEAIEAVWAAYWAPILKEGGIPRLKGELYDAWFLVNEARKVYHHATGGLCDDLCASSEGIIAMDRARVEKLMESLRDRITTLEAQVRVLTRGSEG